MSNKETHFGNKSVPVDEKKGLVKEVFDSVAGRYDLMNDLMSLGTHRLWKRFVLSKTGLKPGQKAIDVAGGTADLAIGMARQVGETGKVTVFDINREMIKLGKEKCIDQGLLKSVVYTQGDAEAIPFADSSFHVATIGFGIRNVTRIDEALKEMARVVKPGGKVICLEFSQPRGEAFRKLYDLYSFKILPAIGEIVTNDRASYVYLAESIRKFPDQNEFKQMMETAGLFKVRYHNLSNGIAALHVGYKV
ncbi:MAG: bifunctional demethylmenaquinone methyltransferase/2-methoxy-6-polyprenyl-1,4-benzoquinol methylase UbiE [Thermodesulfobacteriota bacterium]